MKQMRYFFILACIAGLTLLVLAGGCRQEAVEQEATTVPPTATSVQEPTATPQDPQDDRFITIAADAPLPPFASFDDFGSVVGFDAELADNLMARAGYDYEFVITNYSGMLESVANGEFDMAMSGLNRPSPIPGLAYSEPYLEVGQVLVVLANEEEILSYHDVPPGAAIGVLADSLAGHHAALEVIGVPEGNLLEYESVSAALVALRDGEVSGVILDNDDAEHYTRTNYEQLKIAGGPGPDSWITQDSYVIAVNEADRQLLLDINEAIAEAKADGTSERIVRNWLVSNETVDMGESLIGTPPDIIVVGVVGQIDGADPASPPDPVGWEIKSNIMSGLYRFDAEDKLVPLLATGMPEVSDDKMEYTFTLRSDLTFPDGTALTAEDVKWSVSHSAGYGSWHVNAFLKDSDGDFIADADAVQVLSPTSVKFVLKQPAPYFLNLLATPPYFVVSEECYLNTPDAARTCSGVGPYEIVEWTAGELLQLKANPQWPSTAPAAENLQIRFYASPERLRNAFELGAVDVAWVGMPGSVIDEFAQQPDVSVWESPPTFKSYLVLQREDTPWANELVRQAVAYAIDREELAAVFGGRRTPLYSPVPSSDPNHVPTEPEHDLDRALELLRLAGYSVDNQLVLQLWYLNDGRYSAEEATYAQTIKQQLEKTGYIVVDLQDASWDTYSAQMSACSYPAFLLGWPPLGWPTRYPAAMGWIDYFITNTDSLCSNYESLEMDTLVAELRRVDPMDVEGQAALYRQIQELWARDYPTLDLTQEGARAVAWNEVGQLQFDRMGLLHYETLTKAAEGN